MSKFKTNYDKVLLGVGGASVAGVLAYIFMAGSSDAAGNTKGGAGKEKFPPALAPAAQDLFQKVTTPGAGAWEAKKIDENQSARLFQGPTMVQKAGEDKPFNLLAKDAPEVRPGVPNEWLWKHDLDLTRSKILAQDDDQDGFTNLEEYLGNSDPKDPQSRPSAATKLELKEIITNKCNIRFQDLGGNTFSFKKELDDPKNNRSNLVPEVGKTLFKDDKRFVLNAMGSGVATIQDTLRGDTFALKSGETVSRPTLQAKVRCSKGAGKEVVIGEGDSMDFKEDFPNVTFRLKKIDPEKSLVTIEFIELGKPAQTQDLKK